jgi:dynein light intermediate chain 1
LSNTYAYGYGHVTLFSPPAAQGGGVLSAEAEEAARVLVHTIPSPDREFAPLLQRLLSISDSEGQDVDADTSDEVGQEPAVDGEEKRTTQRPAVCILLSWKEPWKFMTQLRDWIRLLADALAPANSFVDEPLEIIKEAKLAITLVVQHTESQEELFREGYKEEDFDYISQCLRTAILPLHPYSAVVYISSTPPPQQPGSPLSEAQKVVYASLGLNLAALSPKLARPGSQDSSVVKKDDLNPKHEFMDRMAIVIPAGWDSTAFIRTLSETFSPEAVLSSWINDLRPPPKIEIAPSEDIPKTKDNKTLPTSSAQEEVYASSSPIQETFSSSPPLSPSKQTPSTITQYAYKILNPQAHKLAPTGPPPIETTTKPTQSFLAEMRSHLQDLEAQDTERSNSSSDLHGVSTTRFSSRGGAIGMPSGEASGALDDLGDVSFNVGGVSYDAGRAIERLKRPPLNLSSSHFNDAAAQPLSPGSRVTTPKPRNGASGSLRGEQGMLSPASAGGAGVSSAAGTSVKDLPVDKLEEYFASLMKKGSLGGGVGGSRDVTPSRTMKGGE